MDSATTRRRPCFLDINEGLAFLAETEMGNGFSTHSLISSNTSFKNLSFDSSISSPTRFYHTRFQQPPHFLDSCFLCKKPLAHNRDIFMYRGDIPFCSEECRQQQIDMDEAKDKKINLSASIKALIKKDHINSKTTQEFPLRRDRVVAA